MKTLLIGATALLSVLTGAVAGASPAEARIGGWHGGGGYGYRGGYAGPAVVAGLTGLAVGAALAQPHYYGGWRGGYYGPPPAYYVGPAYYGWYQGCRREWVWSPRWRAYHLVDACF